MVPFAGPMRIETCMAVELYIKCAILFQLRSWTFSGGDACLYSPVLFSLNGRQCSLQGGCLPENYLEMHYTGEGGVGG